LNYIISVINIMVLFYIGYLPIRVIDIFDILLVTYFFYRVYIFIKGTFASRMFIGLFAIVLFGFIAQALEMSGINWLIDNIKTVWVIAFVIVFQPELRRLLLYLGQNRLLNPFVASDEQSYLESVVLASRQLSGKNFGALIVFARNSGLRSVLETGIEIQSKMSSELLLSIFNPRSPLHDGAVIIKNEIIVAAKCLLPLSQNTRIESSLGTRHRAALGLSEQSDAIVLIVSEETGKISIAEDGVLTRGIDTESLKRRLLAALTGLKK
jgi:diadenylate cyclase